MPWRHIREWRHSSTHSLTFALDGSELASRSGRFTPRERAPDTYWIGSWVGPRAGLCEMGNKTGQRGGSIRITERYNSNRSAAVTLSVCTSSRIQTAHSSPWRSGLQAIPSLEISLDCFVRLSKFSRIGLGVKCMYTAIRCTATEKKEMDSYIFNVCVCQCVNEFKINLLTLYSFVSSTGKASIRTNYSKAKEERNFPSAKPLRNVNSILRIIYYIVP